MTRLRKENTYCHQPHPFGTNEKMHKMNGNYSRHKRRREGTHGPSTTRLTLEQYLNKPFFIKQLLEEDEDTSDVAVTSSLDAMIKPEQQSPTPSLNNMDEGAIKDVEQVATEYDDQSYHPAATRTSYPLLQMVTPRTRRKLAQLPTLSQEELERVQSIEDLVNDPTLDTELFYRKLKRRQRKQSPIRAGSKAVDMPMNTALLRTAEVSKQPKLPEKDLVNNTKMESMRISRKQQSSERIQMSIEDRNIRFTSYGQLEGLNGHLTCKRRRAGVDGNIARARDKLERKLLQAKDYEKKANVELKHVTEDIRKWLPLDVVYAFGLGNCASVAQQRASERLREVGTKLRFRFLIQAWDIWKHRIDDLRALAVANSVLCLQCWWRRCLAIQEVKMRRRFRLQQRRQQEKMLLMLQARRHEGAIIITRSLRHYGIRRKQERENERIHAATRLQRCWRCRQEFIAQLRSYLYKKKLYNAAMLIQTHVRIRQAQHKLRVLRDIRREKQRIAVLEATMTKWKKRMFYVKMVTKAQRCFQQWRMRKIRALKRRRALFEKDKRRVTIVQALFRGQKARKYALIHRQQVYWAVCTLQQVWRMHRAKKELNQRREWKKQKRYLRQTTAKTLASSSLKQTASKELKTKWNKMMVMKDKAIGNSGSKSVVYRCAVRIQSAWRGYQERRRLRRRRAREKELLRRANNRKRKASALCIQRYVRGVQGRRRAWDRVRHKHAIQIQKHWRGFHSRKRQHQMKFVARAFRKLIGMWKQQCDQAIIRLQGDAAKMLQKLARRYISRKIRRRLVQRHHLLSEQHAIGQALFIQSQQRLARELLLQSWIFPDVFVDEDATSGSPNKHKMKDRGRKSPKKARPDHFFHVDRKLYDRDESLSDRKWKRVGYHGIWQQVFLDISGGVAIVDGTRTARFLKSLPRNFVGRKGLTVQSVDVAFAKFKEPNVRTIPFQKFKAMLQLLLREKFGVSKSKISEDEDQNEDQYFIKFIQEFVLPSEPRGKKYKAALDTHCTDRLSWAVRILQRLAKRIQQRKDKARLLPLAKAEMEHLARVHAADAIKRKFRHFRFRTKYWAQLPRTFDEYVNHRGRTVKYRHVRTGKYVNYMPRMLHNVTCHKSIPIPFPGDEFQAMCMRHSIEDGNSASSVPIAKVYCIECDAAMCKECFVRDHDTSPLNGHKKRDILSCVHCRMSTSTRVCLQCGRGQVPYCDTCYVHVHKSPEEEDQDDAENDEPTTTLPMYRHKYEPLVVMCATCDLRVGQWYCEGCEEELCKRCLASTHARGHRVRHQCYRLNYYSIIKYEANKKARELLQKAEEDRQRKLKEEEAAIQREEALRQEMTTRIQATFRSYVSRKEAKRYVQLIRKTRAALGQRTKDDRTRNSIPYRVRKVFGLSPKLPSDTTEEIAAREQRIAYFKRVLLQLRQLPDAVKKANVGK